MDLFISRFWSRFRLQNGYATQRDVCVVIVQCSRSRPCRVCVGGVFFRVAAFSPLANSPPAVNPAANGPPAIRPPPAAIRPPLA